MRKLSLLTAAVLLPTLALADPWGSKALGDAIAALLLTGFTALWMLVYMIVLLTTRRSMPIYFGFSAVLVLADVYTIITTYQSNYQDKLDIFTGYFIACIFFAFVLYIGIRNIRKSTEVE